MSASIYERVWGPLQKGEIQAGIELRIELMPYSDRINPSDNEELRDQIQEIITRYGVDETYYSDTSVSVHFTTTGEPFDGNGMIEEMERIIHGYLPENIRDTQGERDVLVDVFAR